MQISKPHDRRGKDVFSQVIGNLESTVDTDTGSLDIAMGTDRETAQGHVMKVAIRFDNPAEAEAFITELSAKVGKATAEYNTKIEAIKASKATRIERLKAQLARLES